MRRLSVIAVLIAMLPLPSLADGFLIPIHRPEANAFSVKYHHVDVFIDNQAATTKVDQMFHNETNIEEEGTYVFPLPKDAAIHKFSMFVGEKEQEGKILDREEARRLYESIVRQRRDPALLEYMDRNTFRARVYPIPANGDKRIRLEYTELLNKTNSLCRYVYPLSTERFSAKPLDDCRITIRLKSRTAISNIYSPSHVVKVEQSKPTEALVTWSAKNVKPDTDLVLYYSVADREVALDVLSFREEGKDGFFMLLASPKVETARDRVLPKNVVFVLDRTGSMAGDKIVQAKGALKYCLNSLRPEDQFNLITFNESPDVLFAELEKPTKERREKALDAVDRLDASGGTNINDALVKALEQFRQYGSERNYVVFITDGLPTVGEQNIETILKNAMDANRNKVRVFTFGVGYDVNAHLLDLLTEKTGGQPEYVLPSEDIEVKVSSFFAKVSEPMLTDIELKADGMRVHDMLPYGQLPDLFKGSQLIVVGRYEGKGKATFTLSGKTAKGSRKWTVTVDMPAHDEERDFIPQIWAARKIGYLLDQVRLHRSDELIKEIVQLSKEWGIPTEFTSFFVDEPNVSWHEGQVRVADAIVRARESTSGSWGVSQSMNSNALKTQSQVMANAPSSAGSGGARLGNVRGYYDASGNVVTVDRIQNVGARTFYQRGNQWVDVQTEGRELKVVQIKQFSNAHFKLLAAYPDLQKYQRLGNMRLFINNQVLEIGDQGKEELTDAEVKSIVGQLRASGGGALVASSSPRSSLVVRSAETALTAVLLVATSYLVRKLG